MAGKLTAKQHRALEALLSEPKIVDAADKAGVGERTLRRWLQAPFFSQAYRQARRDAVSVATGRLQQVAADAVSTLHAVMKEETAPHSARVTAAKTALDLAVRAIENDDMLARIEALESAARAMSSPS